MRGMGKCLIGVGRKKKKYVNENEKQLFFEDFCSES